MTGAKELEPDILKGKILLNLDSEDEGELYVGCAGGTDATGFINTYEDDIPDNSIAYQLSLTGLKGGHSGLDINLGRGNANKILFRFIKEISVWLDAKIGAFEGGSLRNAIPREAFAVVTILEEDETDFLTRFEKFTETIKKEYGTTEPEMKLSVQKTELPAFVISYEAQFKLIDIVQVCPNGVVRMSADMENLVETSLNLATVKVMKPKTEIKILIRSSVDSAKEDVESTVESLFLLAETEIKFSGQYPGWKPNIGSPILKTMQRVYQEKWGKVPAVRAIHAGLECGIIGSVYPDWDMISFGPTIRFPHSPDEKVNIKSVGLFWEFLVETLKNIPEK
jgi:dipeptidase D